MRPDLRLINNSVSRGQRVLDLGCGDGDLLELLRDDKQVDGLGVEIDSDRIAHCLSRGLNVIQQDINDGLSNFQTDSFDLVLMTYSLQTLRHPHLVIDEMLRIGRECIVTFPNFGTWRNRWQLGSMGRMPVSRFLPYDWYDTPNIHFFTVRDFEELCEQRSIRIINRSTVDAEQRQSWIAKRWPNLFAVSAVYHISK